MNIDKISRYLAGEMDSSERNEFEKQLQTDPVLKSELEEYKNSIDALKQYSTYELKQRLIRRESEIHSLPNKYAELIWVLSLTFILVFLAWNLLRKPVKETSNPFQRIYSDTIIQDPIPSPSDSINHNYDTTDIYLANVNTDKIFESNFEPFRDEVWNDVVRGETSLSPYEVFLKHYMDKKYHKALQVFDDIDSTLKDNSNTLFVKANALMATAKFEEAIKILNKIIKLDDTRYLKQTYWYLALCKIKLQDVEAAIKALEHPTLKDDKQATAVLNLLKE